MGWNPRARSSTEDKRATAPSPKIPVKAAMPNTMRKCRTSAAKSCGTCSLKHFLSQILAQMGNPSNRGKNEKAQVFSDCEVKAA